MPVRFRWPVYAGVSAALAAAVTLRAVTLRPNFYSAAIFLSQSSANLIVLTNLLFVVACSFIIFLQKVLYGPLRPIEVEQLYEKAWFAVTETCLAMTIFRGEIGLKFLAMFFALLAGKVWGWIGEGRVEVLEQGQGNNRPFAYTKLALSLGIGVAFSMGMLEYAVDQVARMPRPDMMVMFGFEFAILSISSLSTAARMAINVSELIVVRSQKRKKIEALKKQRQEEARMARDREARNAGAADGDTQPSEDQPAMTATDAQRRAEETIDENEIEVDGWEGKGRWIFYLDLATDFFKLIVYLSFFFILLVFYGLPIHILRDVFLTCRSFFKRIADFIRYRTATKDMNERYPDATAQEIAQQDVCIICRDEMRPYQPAQGGQHDPVAERNRPKKLPCGHVLHFRCLRDWLERQQICPTCRRPVLAPGQAGTANQGAGQRGQGVHGAQQGPRVFQFGPLRIGIGAARGNNMFEELQNQLAVDQPQPNPAGANANGPQQYGFGIRWDGLRRRSPRRSRNGGTISEQLEGVNRAIQRELDDLRLDAMELEHLVGMNEQLARLRDARQGAGRTATQPAVPNTTSATVLAPDHTQNIVEAGSERLPNGLTLPEGWSMMPLQPHQGPLPNIPAMPLPPFPHMMPNAMFNMLPGQVPPVQFGQNIHPPMQFGQNIHHPMAFPGMAQVPGQTQEPPQGPTDSLFTAINNLHPQIHPTMQPQQSATIQTPQQPQPLRQAPEAGQIEDNVNAASMPTAATPALREISTSNINLTNGQGSAPDLPSRARTHLSDSLHSTGETEVLRSSNGVESQFSERSQPVPQTDLANNQNNGTTASNDVVPLPSWGSSAQQQQPETSRTNGSPEGTNGEAGTDEVELQSSNQASNKNPRSATVEDLVDSPD